MNITNEDIRDAWEC